MHTRVLLPDHVTCVQVGRVADAAPREYRSKGHPGALQRHRYALPLVKSVLVVTKRQITLMMRDGALTRGRFMQVCQGLGLGLGLSAGLIQ